MSDREKPEFPKAAPRPEYEERQLTSKTPTGEWQVPPPLAHLIKRLITATEGSETKLKRRNKTRLGAVVMGLLGVGGGGYGTWNAHDKVDEMSRRVHQLEHDREQIERDLVEARIAIARCCPGGK